MKYSTQLGNDLRVLLFVRRDELYLKNGSPVTYEVKPGHKALATETWAVHGVCVKCHQYSISAGRCGQCGTNYGKGLYAAVSEQRELAVQALRKSKSRSRT